MADILFPCPHCKQHLATDGDSLGNVVSCPKCGARVAPPKPTIYLTCQKCRTSLSAPQFMNESCVQCPRCGHENTIQHDSSPPDAILRQCCGCGRQIESDALICIDCGVNQKTGAKTTTDLQAGNRLKIHQANPSNAIRDEINPILARFQRPPPRRPTLAEQLMPIAKIMPYVLTLAGLVYFLVNHEGILRRLHITSIPSAASTNTVTEPIISTSIATSTQATQHATNSTHACKLVDDILKTLATLGTTPEDTFATRDLKAYIRSIDEAADGRVIVAGLKSVYALQQLAYGDVDTGLKGIDTIQRGYSDTPFAEIANRHKLFIPCTQCQAGQANIPCDTCSKSGKCSSCKGTGQQQIQQRTVNSMNKGGSVRYKAIGSDLYTTTTVLVPCSQCKGTGKCSTCGGAGVTPASCQTCKGTGLILSASNSKALVTAAINTTTALLTAMQLNGHILTTHSAEDPNLAMMKSVLNDKQHIELFDGMIKACIDHSIRISIDPDVLEILARTRVQPSEFRSVTNAASLETMLLSHHLTLKHAPVAPESTNKIDFVTTDDTWAYSLACWYLACDNPLRALTTLQNTKAGGSTYGPQCQAVYACLKRSLQDRQASEEIMAKVNEAIRLRNEAVDRAHFVENAPDLDAWHGVGKHNERGMSDHDRANRKAAAQQHLHEADKRFDEANAAWTALLKQQRDHCDDLWIRLNDANDKDLQSEVYYWLQSLCNDYKNLFQFAVDLKAKGALASQTAQDLLGEMPAEIPQIKEARKQELIKFQDFVSKVNGGTIRTATEEREIEEMLLTDKANIFARVNVGMMIAERHIKAAQEMMSRHEQTIENQAALMRDFFLGKKFNYLMSCSDVMDKDIKPPPCDVGAGIGAAGLCVVATHGELFPLSVKIVPLSTNIIKSTIVQSHGASTYWQGYYRYWNNTLMLESEFSTPSQAITFADYGEKDIEMKISAQSVYKWLRNTYPREMSGKGIVIDFQSPTSNKAGPSAGVTMAVSAYSSLFNKPLLHYVAMTGDCRFDGSVHAIGGVYEKVLAAAASEGIEIILVPRDNDPDLLLLPADVLCRSCIVECRDIASYIAASTDQDFNKDALEFLRKAQILIRLGRHKEAEPLLWKCISLNPEIYSAKRLLELLRCYGVTDSV